MEPLCLHGGREEGRVLIIPFLDEPPKLRKIASLGARINSKSVPTFYPLHWAVLCHPPKGKAKGETELPLPPLSSLALP